ncbi:MAG TPA: hypothetical protein VJT31_40685 [Rugosimonospora sp.]|nr:hypothetical protein [Rugosimonospora sp.]
MRFYRSLFMLLCAAGVGALASMQPAAAGTYPAPPPAVRTDTGTVSPGGTVTFSGTGFHAFETVRVEIHLPDGTLQVRTVTADASGSFALQLALGRGSGSGTATITARGLTSNTTVSTTVTVLGEQEDEPASHLPVTGQNGRQLAWKIGLGLGAVLVGAPLAWLARTRRRVAR